MDFDEFIPIGYVKKTNGIQGEIKMSLDDWDHQELKKIKALFFKQDEDLVPYMLSNYRISNSNELIAKLEDVDVIEDANEFIHKQAFVPKDLMQVLDSKKFNEHVINGYKVMDEQYGDLGFVTEITSNTQQKMMLIENGADEILIPFVDEMIVEIDHDSETIILHTPEGLIDLNQEEEA